MEKILCLKTDVVVDGKKYHVSTVDFLWAGSLAFQLCGYLYETMLFAYDGDEVNYTDLYCERYLVKKDAEKRHNELVEQLKNGVKFWE